MISRIAPATDTSHADETLPVRDFALLLLQLVLVTLLVWQFDLEPKRHLLAALVLATGGFAIHAWLPPRWRRSWFVAISAGAVVLVLGPVPALWVFVISTIMIALSVMRVSVWLRIILILLVGAICVWLRYKSPATFWPIVGSIFMFRMALFLQTVCYARQTPSLSETASYFMLLPNVFFPLFPVIDFATFRETYYNADRRRIYQTGVHWLATGLLHLLLYRLIKHELLLTPLEIRTATDLAQFLAMNYALYVRVSGQFHIICGMLHLFGFHLPRTHDAYFLASSFSDIWRRINIYWKDFMTKSFFYPAYFRLRRYGNAVGVVMAVMWVFVWTWLGHSWQAFWLLGDFPLRFQDALLWIGVGVLVSINGVLDYRRAQRPVKRSFSLLRATVYSLQVIGVFACVSVFWTQWSHPEVLKLVLYSTTVLTVSAHDVFILGSIVGAAVVIGVIYQLMMQSVSPARTLIEWKRGEWSMDSSVAVHLMSLIGVLLLAQPPVYTLFGAQAAQVIAGLQKDRISRGEALAEIAGYYEELNDQALQAGPFLGDPRTKPAGAMGEFSDMIRHRDDFLDHELIPNWTGSWRGAAITVNRWGMRDKDRDLIKPAHVTRIALVGSSLVMGYGVNDEQTFSRLLEDRLNAMPVSADQQYEVLNFGVGRYSPLHRKLQIEQKVRPFEPDLVIYFAHQDELYTSVRHIGPALYHGMKLNDPCLEKIIGEAGIVDRSSEALIQLKLEPYHISVLQCVYRGMVESAKSMHAGLLYAYLPIPGNHDLPFDPQICLQMASQAGMETASLAYWEGDRRPEEVLISPNDHHANVLGHRLLADAIEPILRRQLAQSTPEP